jgi:microcompartment protein CcmK/EutM
MQGRNRDDVKLARVIAQVVATRKPPAYRGLKTFMVKHLGLDGTLDGRAFVAIDRVQAGIGDTVLLMQEGSSARTMFGDETMPARSVIVGIVDHVETEK